MDENIISTKLDSVLAGVDKLSDRVVALETKSDLGFKSLKVEDVQKDPYKPFKAGGLSDFLYDVKEAANSGRISDRLAASIKAAAGLNEGVGSEGGFLVNTDFASELIRPMHDVGVFTSKVNMIPISANSNAYTAYGVDETSRADGSQWGGVVGYWLAEAGTKVASKPKFRSISMKLNKVAALAYATDELLADATALQATISQSASEVLDWKVNNAVMNGTGVGQPLGILASPALVTVAKEAGQGAATLVYANIIKMWSRLHTSARAKAAWYINQDVEPQLFSMTMAVGTGGVPVYMPAGGISGAPHATLFGRPVIATEFQPALGTVGDILLADMSQYIMIEKGGVEAASSIHVNFLTDETAFRFVYRTDGQPSWNSALTPANSSNTQSPFVALATRA